MSFKYSVEKDGITQSLLNTFLQCRQKAKLSIEGWTSRYPSFAMTFGTFGHSILENVYKDIQSRKLRNIPSKQQVIQYVSCIENLWKKENPRADKKALEYLELSCLIAESLIPLYFEYWSKDLKEIHWISLEHEFKIPFITESGLKTILRGKIDGVFSSSKKIWLLENKFKSHIDEENLMDTLPKDFQSLFYLYALSSSQKVKPAGFLYNIIRRIQLRQGTKESITQFSERSIKDIRERPEFYFIRREVSIGLDEMKIFENDLDSLITDFINWMNKKLPHYPNRGNCKDKYGRCVFLSICSDHGYNSYTKKERIFTELE